MKSITIQANLIEGWDVYQLTAGSDEKILKAIFVEITEDDIKDILEMMED